MVGCCCLNWGCIMLQSAEELAGKKCVACEGGVPKFTVAQAEGQVKKLPGWKLTHGGERIRKDWTVKDFMAGIEFFRAVAEVAEQEDHHPDLHLEGYRNIWIEIWTHAVGGIVGERFYFGGED